MRALTVRQPWATLLVRGVKRFETRSWAYRPFEYVEPRPYRDYGGEYRSLLPMRIAIHAAKAFPVGDQDYTRWLRDVLRLIDTEDLPLGMVVGEATYVGPILSSPATRRELRPSRTELELGDWSDGRVLWSFTDPIEWDVPIPVRGKQGVWRWARA